MGFLKHRPISISAEETRDMYIKKEDLVVDTHYKCDARNFEVGVWNGKGFIYRRTKFGVKYLDLEYHYDDGPPHGTVKPLEVVDG